MSDKELAKIIINDIVENIPEYCKNDQLKTFTYIYYKLATMLEYDKLAASIMDSHISGYDRERAFECIVDPASGIECLVRGRAICVGYSEVMKTILNKLGIETVTVRSETHQWNQVFINGKWYNCDLSKDRNFLVEGLKCQHFLTSNDDDCNYTKPVTTTYKECTETISEEMQEQLLNEAREYLENKKREQELQELQKEKLSVRNELKPVKKSKFGFIDKIKEKLNVALGGKKR